MDNPLELKKTPQALEAEKGVIGSMIQDNDTIVTASQMLNEDDFHSDNYRKIFNVILKMEHDGLTVDLVSLQENLKTKNLPKELYSVEFLRKLIEDAIPSNISNYCEIVKEKSNLRKIISALSEGSKDCYSNEDNATNIVSNIEQKLFNLQKNNFKTKIASTGEIAKELIAKITYASKMKGGLVGVPSGYRYLDKMLSGFQKQNLIILAGRTGMGKTSFALNVAANIVLRAKKPIAIFSLEMSSVEILARIISIVANINSKTIREGSLKDEEWATLIRDMDRLSKIENLLQIDDTPAITIQELRAKCRYYKNTYGLDMVIIDYLQLMRSREKTLENRTQEVSEISRNLKALAKELDVPIMALAQVGRSAEQRDSKRPLLSDLRESGSIEQDADIVLFVHRPGYYVRDNEVKPGEEAVDPTKAEIIVAKHRNGETGTVDIRYEASLTKFYDTDDNKSVN